MSQIYLYDSGGLAIRRVEGAIPALPVYLVNGGGGGTASNFADPFPGGGTAAGAEDPGGDMAPLLVDGSGNLLVAGSLTVTPVTSTAASAVAQTTVGTTEGQVLAANANRKRLILQNVGTTVIKVSLGAGPPTQTAFHFALRAGGTADDGSSPLYSDDMWKGEVRAISSGSGGLLVVTELT